MMFARVAALVAGCLALLGIAGTTLAATPDATVGLGGYYTKLKGGDPALPVAEFVSGEAVGKAAPTNQWYSSVMFQRWSQAIHAHPMTYRATEEGFELGLPTKRLANVGGSLEVSYPHVPAIVVAPVGFKPKDARLSKFSDWLAQVSMAAGAGRLAHRHGAARQSLQLLRVQHGRRALPFRGQARHLLRPDGSAHDKRVVAVTVAGQSYAIFAPTGATWQWAQPTELVLQLPADARYFSVAGLPDARDATLGDFLAVAYAFPTDTRVEWSYDEAASKVRSVFRVQTVAMEGQNLTTFMGLYPHHWSSVVSDHPSQVRVRLRARPHPPGAGQQLHARARLSRLRPHVGRASRTRPARRASAACWSAILRSRRSCSARWGAARTGSARASARLRS